MNEFNYLASLIAMILAVFIFYPRLSLMFEKQPIETSSESMFLWLDDSRLARGLAMACTEKVERRAKWQPY